MIGTPHFGHRPLWFMIMGGVLERFPRLKFAMTEAGAGWVPTTLKQLDGLHMAMKFGRTGEVGLDASAALPMKPSEYFERNVWVGVSFPGVREAKALRKLGLHKVMWGSDYPHNEGTSPYSHESLRRTFHDWTPEHLRQVPPGTAAAAYGSVLAGRDQRPAHGGGRAGGRARGARAQRGRGRNRSSVRS